MHCRCTKHQGGMQGGQSSAPPNKLPSWPSDHAPKRPVSTPRTTGGLHWGWIRSTKCACYTSRSIGSNPGGRHLGASPMQVTHTCFALVACEATITMGALTSFASYDGYVPLMHFHLPGRKDVPHQTPQPIKHCFVLGRPKGSIGCGGKCPIAKSCRNKANDPVCGHPFDGSGWGWKAFSEWHAHTQPPPPPTHIHIMK